MKKNLLAMLLPVVLVASCGGGNSSTSTSNNPDWNPPKSESGPSGPMSYQYIIDNYYAVNQRLPQVQKEVNKSLNGVFAPTCGLAATGVGTVTGAFAFLPVVGTVFGTLSAVAGFIGGQASSSCVTQQLSAINANLNYQESQIQSLQVGTSYFENQFAQDNYLFASEISTLADFNFSQSLSYFIGNNSGNKGLFTNLMIDSALWSDSGQAYNFSPNMVGLTQLLNLSASPTDQEEFQQNLANLAGVGHSSCTINCYKNVSADKNTALFLTLNTLYTQLNSELQLINNINTLPTSNIVAEIDGYNNTLTGIFIQSVVALQEAYAIEFLVNLSNFEYINNTYYAKGVIQPSPLGNIYQANSYSNTPGAYFNYLDLYYNNNQEYPSIAQVESTYNKAQEQLTLNYAAIINQLYQTILSYTLSDSQIGNQVYPAATTGQMSLPNGKVENYSYMIPYSLTNTASISLDAIGTIQTPLSLLGLESINISGFGSWSTPGYMIYQYAINNVSQCITSIDKYNINNTNANFIDFAQAVENGKFQCDPVLGAYMGNYIPGQYLSFYWADQTIHAPIATLGASWNNLSNTPTTFIGNIYNINNYSLNVIYDNQPGVYYLVNGSYNQPASSAAGANTTWSQLGATQYFTNTELEYNQSYNTNYIPFYPTIYNTATGSMTVNLLSSASSFNSYYPGVLPNGFSINTTPNASNVPFFNPLGYDTSFPSCGSANNVISYILPDGTPLPLDIYLGSSSCKGSEQYNIPAFAQLFYNPANYPTVNCNASTAVCTTPNGNSYQLNFTANSASGIALSATIIN